jgi:hypothetical protein
MLLPRTEVIGLKLDGKRVKSLDLKVGRDPKTYDPRFNKDPKPKKWDAQTLQLGDKTINQYISKCTFLTQGSEYDSRES